MLGIIIIIFVMITFVLSLTNYFRMRNMKREQQRLSLVDLAEFEHLSPQLKEVYKLHILDMWVKTFNESLNKSISADGLDTYFKDNKDKLIELNNLYLELAKLNMEKNKSVFDDSFKVFVYNADLDKLIKEAKEMRAQLQIK